MAMTDEGRAVLERWVGEFQDGDVDNRLARLQNYYAVALELLQKRLAILSAQATEVAAGGRRVKLDKTITSTERQIGRLVGYVTAQDVSLSGAAEDLFLEAAGDSTDATTSLVINSPNRRRAG